MYVPILPEISASKGSHSGSHSPHAGMTTLHLRDSQSFLALLMVFLQNPKSDFTPLRPAGRRSVKCRGFASGGSAFSFRPSVSFLIGGGGINRDLKNNSRP